MKHATELVWDRNGSATAMSGSCLLAAGLGTDWTPVALLATSTSVSLLDTFLELAQGALVPILGYVARQGADLDGRGDLKRIHVVASISVPSDESAAQAQALFTLAVHEAPVLRTLRCPVLCEPCIVVLSEPDLARE